MTSDPGLSRRVSRLENDVASLYELVTDIRSVQDEHTQRFDEHDRRFDEHDRRFDEHDRRFDEHTGRFDEHTGRFDTIDATLAEIVRRLPEPT